MGCYTGVHSVNQSVTVIDYLDEKLGPKQPSDIPPLPEIEG